jgi:UDP-N-acetylmuramate--alanine ligase
LIEAGLDPTVLIGGVSLNLGSNARVGRGDVVVAEADEYDASFLRLRPEVAVITNVEPDHLDFYHTVERLHAAFRDFSRGVAGTLVVCADDPILPELVGDLATRVVTYSLHGGDWRAWNVAEEQDRTLFRAEYAGVALDYAMGLAGLHNVRNALAALVVADTIGVSRQRAAQALATFRGVERRFQLIGEAGGVLVIDDYAHHPTEMRASLCALRQRFGRTLRLVFQPHTYSRTRALMQDFAEALRGADAVYLLDIYPARETDTLGVSGRDLYDAARQSGASVAYAETIDGALKALLREVQPGDLVVTMGAGDVYRLGPRVLEELRSR